MQVIGYEGYGQTNGLHYDSTLVFHSFCKLEGCCPPAGSNPQPAAPIQSYAGPHQTCGIFDVYYEDILLNNNWGFNEPGNGPFRGATICAVLTYLQSTFDFPQALATNHIRIEIESSFQAGFNPAPANWLNTIAAATPLFPPNANSTPGYYSGYIHDKVTNYPLYLTYNYTGFDGRIRFNFNAIGGNNNNISLQVNHTLPLGNCQTDMYSVALHEMLHLMGWFSMIQEDATQLPQHNNAFINNPNTFSHLDQQFLLHGNIFTNTFQPWIISEANPTINPNLIFPNSMRDNQTWKRSLPRFQDNHPVYSGSHNPLAAPIASQSLFSHMDGQPDANNRRYWVSPGFNPRYVMEPFMAVGIQKRLITNEEIRTLMALGYNLNNTFSNTNAPNSAFTWGAILSNNHKPECLTDYATLLNMEERSLWIEGIHPTNNITVDFTIQNDGNALLIDLNAIPNKIIDADGDLISAIPETLVGIRGVSDGDNNDNRLTLLNNDQIISYTPRPNFIGRAQFYVQLFDGKERGAIALFTIDVTTGSNFVNTPPNEMVINGSFEEGTEVKDFNTLFNQNKEGNTRIAKFIEGPFFYGYALPDAAPLYQMNFPWTANSGVVIRNAYKSCGTNITPYEFGFNWFGFPNADIIPASTTATNNRYSYFKRVGNALSWWHTNYSSLAISPTQGSFYELSYDVFLPNGYTPGNFTVEASFTNQFDLYNPVNTFTFQFNQNVPFGTGQWQHVVQQFQYCSTDPALYMELSPDFPTLNTPFGPFIDNISLIQIPNPFITVQASASPSSLNCMTTQSQLNAAVSPANACLYTYQWVPSTGLSNPNIANPLASPTSTTIYTVTVTDVNNTTATASVTITVLNGLPTPTFTLSNSCIPNAGSVSLNVTAPLGAGIQYQLNGGAPQANTVFSNINIAGSYTITAIANANCTSSVVVNIPSCPYIPCQALPLNPNTVYVTANNTTTSTWPANNFPSGVPVVFDGVFTVDQNLSMLNNPNIYFTPNSQVILTNGSILTIDNSTLQGCGPTMWDGIRADVFNEKVIISNNTTLRDMNDGVVISNGAAIDCQNSRFVDNNLGIQFVNTPGNYTSPVNLGIVLNNEFTSSGNPLMSPFNTQSKSNVGILAVKCKSLQIGELVYNSNNNFHDIFTGIFDLPAPNMSQVLRSYNNKFSNIKDDYSAATFPEGALLNSFYTTHRGAGIIGIEYFGGNTSNLRKIEVQSMVDDGGFFNCDKAVVANNISVDASDNIVDNCRGGFLFSLATGQFYNIQRNRISDVFTGIQVIGDPLKVNILNHDAGNQAYINLQTNGMTTGANNMQEWPVAVDIKFATYTHPGSVNVNNNDIFIPGIGGRGVAFALTGQNTAAIDNTITFTTTDASTYQGPNMPHLMGFHTFFAVGSRLDCNTVNGLTNPAAWGIRNSQGILMYESRRMEVACNFVNFTHHGLLPFGDCGTTNDRVRGNLFFNHIWGMLFAPSVFGNEGTVGDIGLNQNYDNNNQFWGMYVNTPFNYQVYRWWWLNPTLNKIFTLQPINSGSNVANFEYQPNPTPNPLSCNSTCQNIQPQIAQLDSLMNLGIALEIANDSLNLPVFPEVGEWLARRRLYADLDQDSAARNSNTTLLNFYNTYTTQTINDLYQTDRAIVSLTDSASYADTLLFAQRLTTAQAQNQSISSIHNYELNEQWINALYLDMLERGSDSISVTELVQLESIAKSCPAIAGTAVYKARTLYAKYEPALSYNDFGICGSSLSFKNGNPFDSLLSFINQTTNQYPDTNRPPSLLSNKDEVSIYPNPASDLVTVRYQFIDAKPRTFILFDMLGRELKKVELKPSVTSVQVDVSQQVTGLYTYSIYNKNRLEFTGKLTIAK